MSGVPMSADAGHAFSGGPTAPPICVCGHRKIDHDNGVGVCFDVVDEFHPWCPCERFSGGTLSERESEAVAAHGDLTPASRSESVIAYETEDV